MSDPSRFTFSDVLHEHALTRPGAVAGVCGDHRYSWRELEGRVVRLAAALARAGVGCGDRVLWLGQNCHRVLELLIACSRMGAMLCPANWRQSPPELASLINDLQPRLVLWQLSEIGERVAEARTLSTWAEEASWLRHDAAGQDGYEALINSTPRLGQDESDPGLGADAAAREEEDHHARRSDMPLLILYTAAFDGRPNGAMLPQRALLAQAVIGNWLGLACHDDVYLNCGPLFHVGTLKMTLAVFVAGGTNVFTPRVDAEELCRLIDGEGCTGAFLQPPTIERMVAANADGRYDLSSLRAKAGPPAWNAMITVDDRPLLRSGYGQTEVAGVVTYLDPTRPCLGSAGRPGPLTRVEILDESGHPCPAGEVGEIVVRGPMVMAGYFRRPQLTEARRGGGWHHTGDLGRREADGSLSFLGPMARLIKSAAENIYPAEVEACLRTHPAVADAAVIGVPDDRWGQSVKAVVVLSELGSATGQELIDHCRARIASYKKPRWVEFVASLPRHEGTVDYDQLDRLYGSPNLGSQA